MTAGETPGRDDGGDHDVGHGTQARGRCPDAIVVGATKAGTTSLFHYLSDHPQVFMDPQKELRFFSDPARYALGPDWYRARFAAAGDRVAMESSNSYTRDPVYPGVAERMAAVCPDARLVYLVRDPIDRLVSHYRHRVATGREWRTPDDAVAADPSYVAASLFGHQLSIHLRHRDLEQVHVARSDELGSDDDRARAALCDFLGIDHDPARPWPRENTTSGRAAVPAALRRLYGLTRSERVARWGRTVAGRRRPVDAGAVEVDLSDRLRRELDDRFAADRELFVRLTQR